MPRSRNGASTTLIDPRLRDRRIEVARDQGRKRLRRFVVLAVLVLLVGGAVAATRSPLLDVDRVQVRGAANTDAAAARKAAGVELGRPMVSVDPAAVERRIARLPWVQDATVTRSWPGTVTVTLVERTPVATMGSGSSAVLVDDQGRVLGPAAGAKALPEVAGTPRQAGRRVRAAQRSALSVVAGLPVDLRRQVVRAWATPSGVVLRLDDDIVVRWGDTGQPSAKAEALRVLLDEADRPTIATIDVSVPRAATLTRQTGGGQ